MQTGDAQRDAKMFGNLFCECWMRTARKQFQLAMNHGDAARSDPLTFDL